MCSEKVVKRVFIIRCGCFAAAERDCVFPDWEVLMHTSRETCLLLSGSGWSLTHYDSPHRTQTAVWPFICLSSFDALLICYPHTDERSCDVMKPLPPPRAFGFLGWIRGIFHWHPSVQKAAAHTNTFQFTWWTRHTHTHTHAVFPSPPTVNTRGASSDPNLFVHLLNDAAELQLIISACMRRLTHLLIFFFRPINKTHNIWVKIWIHKTIIYTSDISFTFIDSCFVFHKWK